ncbi:MAG: HNH endonuclease [Endomicrobium sp.]|nr:HNH endonuclease [Endomicrobium sp.]
MYRGNCGKDERIYRKNKYRKFYFQHSYQANKDFRVYYITTNIRSPQTISCYIKELVPEYLKKKNNPLAWKSWCYDIEQQKKHKQKFKRLELASLLFRNVENNITLNLLAEKLYSIIQKNGIQYVTAFLYLYLLLGRYFGIDKQSLIDIDKITNSFNDDLVATAQDLILKKNHNNKLFISSVLYNPTCDIAYEFAYKILSNEIKDNDLEDLYKYINGKGSPLRRKIVNADGEKNFVSDVFTVVNYYIFKEACLKNTGIDNLNERKEKIINTYVDLLFTNGLNKFLEINDNDKDLTKQVFKSLSKYILEIIFYASGIKEEYKNVLFDKNTRRKFSLDQKQEVINKYEKRCFFDYFGDHSAWHKEGYFLTKKCLVYLEIHHIIKLEHSHLFNNDIDIRENMIPLCPNCHRKLHNVQNNIVKNLLIKMYSGIDKKAWIKKGIFVDINTLGSFYGLEGDLEKNK